MAEIPVQEQPPKTKWPVGQLVFSYHISAKSVWVVTLEQVVFRQPDAHTGSGIYIHTGERVGLQLQSQQYVCAELICTSTQLPSFRPMHPRLLDEHTSPHL